MCKKRLRKFKGKKGETRFSQSYFGSAKDADSGQLKILFLLLPRTPFSFLHDFKSCQLSLLCANFYKRSDKLRIFRLDAQDDFFWQELGNSFFSPCAQICKKREEEEEEERRVMNLNCISQLVMGEGGCTYVGWKRKTFISRINQRASLF